jgi:hypothetical protein
VGDQQPRCGRLIFGFILRDSGRCELFGRRVDRGIGRGLPPIRVCDFGFEGVVGKVLVVGKA